MGLCGDVKASYLSLSLSLSPGHQGLVRSCGLQAHPNRFRDQGSEKRENPFVCGDDCHCNILSRGPSASHFTQKERPDSPPDEQYELSPMEPASTIPVSQGFTTPPSLVTKQVKERGSKTESFLEQSYPRPLKSIAHEYCIQSTISGILWIQIACKFRSNKKTGR